MGRTFEFSRALIRGLTIEQGSIPATPGSGSKKFKGWIPGNVHWDIYLACSHKSASMPETFIALHTTITLSGLYDLIEMQQCTDAWERAALANMPKAENVS